MSWWKERTQNAMTVTRQAKRGSHESQNLMREQGEEERDDGEPGSDGVQDQSCEGELR